MSYLYLFTSTYGEYYKDVAKILALPEGFQYRFRYEVKHLAGTVPKPKDFHRLTNQEGIVALKNVRIAEDGNGDVLTSLPIRRVKIIQVEYSEDAFAYFHFELLGFPPLTNESAQRFSDHVRKQLTEGPLVHNVEQPYSFGNRTVSQDTSWRFLVDKLAHVEKFDSTVFIRLHAVVNEKDGSVAPISNRRYRLRGGEHYRLEFAHLYPGNLFEKSERQEIAQQNGNPEDGRAIRPSREMSSKLFFSTELISPILASQPIQGRYDVNKHHFYCYRNMRGDVSLLVLDADSPRNVYFPRTEIPITIKKRWTRDTFFLLAFAIGLLLAGVADMIVRTAGAANKLGQDFTGSSIPGLVVQSWLESNLVSPMLTILGLVLAFITRFPRS